MSHSTAKNAKPAKGNPLSATPALSAVKDSRSPRPDAPLMVADVARRWRTSYQKILDLVDEGRLRAFNIGGRNPSGRRFLRIPPESVQEFERLNSTLLDPKTGRLLTPKPLGR